MSRLFRLLPLVVLYLPLAACGSLAAVPTLTPVPTATRTPKPTPPIIASPIPLSNAEGTPISEQPGFVEWVLLSGVDEHGLTAEHTLSLLVDAAPDAPPGDQIHTGAPVQVLEIRHVGPQNLQRFYRVRTLDGLHGWISDFYVRRQAYLFNFNGVDVPLFHEPRGAEIGRLPNVTPVTLLQPQALDWWQVSTLDGGLVGWVEVGFVKESPEDEYLFGNDHVHECLQCPYFLP